MDWHYDVTMHPIMMSKVIIMLHEQHYTVAFMTFVLQLDGFLYCDLAFIDINH